MKCIVKDTDLVIASEVEEAKTFKTRLLGLMFRPSLAKGKGLWLEPCPQIHMFFMRFAIDVIFVDHSGLIIGVLENFKPWRVSPIFWGARGTLELPAGTLNGKVKKGDRVEFVRP